MNQSISISPALSHYIERVSVTMSPAQHELRKATAALPGAIMQISPEQGQFMTFLMQLLNVRKALEVGTYTGYSAMCIAAGLPADGQLVTCDIEPKTTQIAQDYWQRAQLAEKISLRLGPAIETLNELLEQGSARTFDFAFIDADKENYDTYYELALRLLRPQGVIMIDNVLWDGKVIDPRANDPSTKAIKALNEKLRTDARVSISMIPLGDGVTLARKL